MIFNIPKWPDDSELTHDATSWKLTRDLEGNEVEDNIDESTDYLDFWEVDKIIPTGEIWYISSLRRLKDSDGASISNDVWIGPKPIFNEESNTKDYLTPELNISEPYIRDVEYLPGEKITIVIPEPKTNVAYEGTSISLYDDSNTLVYGEIVNYYDNDGIITITSDAVDLASIYKLNIVAVNIASHSTLSKVVFDAYYLKKVFYNIEGNTLDLDYTGSNTLKVLSTSEYAVTLDSAELLSLDGTKLANIDTAGNTLTIPVTISINSSYRVKLYLSYTDANGNTQTTTDLIFISTAGREEKFIPDLGYVYENNLTPVSIVSDNQNDIYDGNANVEEFFNNVVAIKQADDKLEFDIIDKQNNHMTILKGSNISIAGDYTLRLVTKTKGYIQTKDSNGLLVLTGFDYDPFKDIITLGTVLTTDIVIDTPVIRKVMEMPDNLYVVGVSKVNSKNVNFYTLDLDAMVVTLVNTYVSDTDLTDVSVSEVNDTEVVILPKGTNAFKSVLFNVLDGYKMAALSIHTNFKNKDLVSFRLKNDKVVVFKLGDTTDRLNYFIYDRKGYKITNKVVRYNGDAILQQFISARNGRIYLLLNDMVNNQREFFKFQ